ncbi:MAG: biotin/lipoyl-binding protein, partial [Candidatus Limnocylindrales bacterium]
MRRLLIALGIVVVLVAVVAIVRPFRTARTTIETATASRGTLLVTIELAGSVAPRDERTVAFAASGTVTTVDVATGDSVARGDLLASLDATLATAQLEAARAQLASAEARTAATRDRYDGLDQTPAIDAAVAADAAAVASAKASIASAQQAVNQAELRAPIAGTVGAVSLRAGDRVGAGSATG